MVQQGHDLHLEQSNTLVSEFNGFAVMIGSAFRSVLLPSTRQMALMDEIVREAMLSISFPHGTSNLQRVRY